MATQEQLRRESTILVLAGMQATESLMFHLRSDKEHMYLLTDNLHTIIYGVNPYCPGVGAVCFSAGGELHPEGIDAFIEKALSDPNCRCLIPLTEQAKSSVAKRNLHVTEWGFTLTPENVTYQGYR